MNLNYFREFATLAETSNYLEAAERLYIGQSTLSKHIMAMEAELGVPLFERTSRKVTLTEYGALLLPYARAIISTEFNYSYAIQQRKQYHNRLFTLGSIPAMAQYNIINLLLAFHNAHPEYSAKVVEQDSYDLYELLLSQKCELALCREPNLALTNGVLPTDKLARIPYAADHLVAVLPNGHPLAQREQLSLKELEQERFCFIEEGSFLNDLCRSACQRVGIIPDVAFTSHRLDSILDMVTKGHYVALLMGKHVKYPVDSVLHTQPPFSEVRITPAITSQISLCYLKDAELSAGARCFLSFFEQAIQDPLFAPANDGELPF